MAEKKEARIYVRTTNHRKRFLQAMADEHSEGNINKLIDMLVDDLRGDYPEIDEEVSE